ncbi:MAG: MerR family transcriptional regulator [Acidimicrobiaceae bacterium]|nr:MerR family transcriptional regulator [Acidimicrobiaceae bacterium]
MSDLLKPEEPYHSIGQVLSLLADEHPGLSISKIRFLESKGLISPERTSSGYRKFYAHDIERLRWILIQQRDQYLPLKEIKRRLDEAPGLLDDDFSSNRQPRKPTEVQSETLIGLSSTEEESFLDQEQNLSDDVSLHEQPDPKSAVPLLFASLAKDDVASDSKKNTAESRSSISEEQNSPLEGDDTTTKGSHQCHAENAVEHRYEPRASLDNPAAVTTSKTATTEKSLLHNHTPTLEGSVSLTTSDLAQAMDVDRQVIIDLQRLGLIIPVNNPSENTENEAVFSHEALIMVKATLEFAARGVPARNLRMYRIAINREVGVYQQIIATLIARDDRARLQRELNELLDLANTIRHSLLRSILGPYLN